MEITVTRLSASKLARASFKFTVNLADDGAGIAVKLQNYTEEKRESTRARTWWNRGTWSAWQPAGYSSNVPGMAKPVVPQDVMDEVLSALTRPISFA